MKWFRSKIQQTARLALFAMAVQLVLSFGHVHWTNAAPAAPVGSQGHLVQDGVAADPGATVVADHRAPSVPDQHQPPADQCAICAIVSMAGAALLAPPPVLLLPEAVDFIYLLTAAEFDHLGSPSAGFQPRAPPQS